MSCHLLISWSCQPSSIYKGMRVTSPAAMHQAYSHLHDSETSLLVHGKVEIRAFGLSLSYLKVLPACCWVLSLTWVLIMSGDYTFSSRRAWFSPNLVSSSQKKRSRDSCQFFWPHHLPNLCWTKGAQDHSINIWSFFFIFFMTLLSYIYIYILKQGFAIAHWELLLNSTPHTYWNKKHLISLSLLLHELGF